MSNHILFASLCCENNLPFILKPEYIMSALALIISIASLWSQRRHNINSVRPIGVIDCFDAEDNIYVKIENAGTGPLLFTKLEVSNSKGKIEPNIINHMPLHPPEILWRDFLLSVDDVVLAPGDEVTLIQLSIDNVAIGVDEAAGGAVLQEIIFAPFRKDVRAALAELTVTIQYVDIYDKSFKTIKKLNYLFGRH